MKINLSCLIFGHIFRMTQRNDDGEICSYPAHYCKKCGLSKKEIFKLKEKKDE